MKTDQLDTASLEPAKDRRAITVQKIRAREVDGNSSVLLRDKLLVCRFEQFRVGQTERAFNSERRYLSRLTINLSNSCRHECFLLSVNYRVAGWV